MKLERAVATAKYKLPNRKFNEWMWKNSIFHRTQMSKKNRFYCPTCRWDLPIKDRCYNARSKAYKHYGGRGITVCDEWRKSFTAFREWAMSNGYADGLTIDRTDNDGGYLPENCRWSTRKEQARNRSNTLRFGSVPLVEIAEQTGIAYKTLSGRLKRNPNTTYEQLTRPPKKRF